MSKEVNGWVDARQMAVWLNKRIKSRREILAAPGTNERMIAARAEEAIFFQVKNYLADHARSTAPSPTETA